MFHNTDAHYHCNYQHLTVTSTNLSLFIILFLPEIPCYWTLGTWCEVELLKRWKHIDSNSLPTEESNIFDIYTEDFLQWWWNSKLPVDTNGSKAKPNYMQWALKTFLHNYTISCLSTTAACWENLQFTVWYFPQWNCWPPGSPEVLHSSASGRRAWASRWPCTPTAGCHQWTSAHLRVFLTGVEELQWNNKQMKWLQ